MGKEGPADPLALILAKDGNASHATIFHSWQSHVQRMGYGLLHQLWVQAVVRPSGAARMSPVARPRSGAPGSCHETG